jgi:hypothetical protein
MSPQAGLILTEEIIPRLRSTVPRCVQPIGSEDAEELLQDSIAVAAQMLHNVERSGRDVMPAVIACCALLYLQSGWRSNNCSQTDAMAAFTQREGHCCVLSLEESIIDPETEQTVSLGELLADTGNDRLATVTRDWVLSTEGDEHRRW